MPRVKIHTHKTIVITRPAEDAKQLATTLADKGWHCLVEPMLSIKQVTHNMPTLKRLVSRHPQVILATSRHAVSILAANTKPFALPLIAVGKATAAYAKTLGFKNVIAPGGAAQAVIAYVRRHIKPEKGRLLYAAGADITTDIAAALAPHGFNVDTVPVYKAAMTTRFSAQLQKSIAGKNINAVMFFSERTAMAYVRLAQKYDLGGAHSSVCAMCMSPAIAERLHPLPWKKLLIATKPTLSGMIAVAKTSKISRAN